MQPSPSRLVAAQTKDPLEPKCIAPVFLACDKPHSLKPGAKRFSRAVKDRPGGSRCFAPTRRATQQVPGICPRLAFAAGWATKADWPPEAAQVVSACFLSSKPPVEFLKRSRVIDPADRMDVIVHHYILRLGERSG